MKFFNLVDGKADVPAINIFDVEVGNVYNIKNLLDEGIFNDDRQVYFYEFNSPYKESIIMTNMEGRKSFAIHTNDSVRDDFPPHHLAKIVTCVGNFIVYMFSADARKTDIHTLIMRVEDIDPKAWFDKAIVSINVKILYRGVNVERIPELPFLKQAINHTNNVIKNPYPDPIVPKFCLNPGRIVEIRLFQKDYDGELVSYTDDGKKLIVSRKSFERTSSILNTDDEILDNNFIRCFYSRKYKGEELIYVDGYTLPMIDRMDISDYIAKSKDHPTFDDWSIVKVTTTLGNEFYGIMKFGSTSIRPIYKLSDGYATYPMNRYEQKFISHIEILSKAV